MATYVDATDVVIKIGNTIVGCAQSAKFTLEREMNEVTCAAAGSWKQQVPGQMSWNGSFGAVVRDFTVAEQASNVSLADIINMLVDGALVTVEYGRKTGGSNRYFGDAYINSVDFDQPEKGPVTFSANYVGNGPLNQEVDA